MPQAQGIMVTIITITMAMINLLVRAKTFTKGNKNKRKKTIEYKYRTFHKKAYTNSFDSKSKYLLDLLKN